jgi:penicillin-binding protein 1A
MKAAHEKRPATEFPRPAGIVVVKIDPKTGLRAYDDEEDAIDEVFLQGTEPQEISSPGLAIPDGGTELVTGSGLSGDAGTIPADLPAPAPSDAGLPQLPAEDPPPF